MNKNSQYSNQFTIRINELVRISFNETLDGTNSEPIVTIGMFMEAAEILANSLLETIGKHKKNMANQKAGNDTDKELN